LNCGRLVFRAVISAGIVDNSNLCHSRPSISTLNNASGKAAPAAKAPNHKVLASCCGFPKDMVNGPSVVNDHGVFGDDACFIQRHKNIHVAGVADGVGGWRKYGIDPSEFSRRLMKICSELVLKGEFEPSSPQDLIARAFRVLSLPPRPIGSSTACVVVLHHNVLYTANLGDSGFLVMRKGKIIYKSKEQTHYFNAPFQLSLPPESVLNQGYISDSPEKAELDRIEVESGDLVVLATDGLWDNVSDQIIEDHLSILSTGNEDVQLACNALALTARRLAFDSCHVSPFALKASQHGLDCPGGKPDDITLVLILIK